LPGRRFGLGTKGDIGQIRYRRGLDEKIDLELPPVGRVGQGDPIRGLGQPFLRLIDHPPQHPTSQCLGRIRTTTDKDRHVVADAALVFADHSRRVSSPTALGCFTDEHGAVSLEVKDRRNL
jgi:hypothetical protein